MAISIFKDRYATNPIGQTEIEDYLHDVKSGRWQDHVLKVRTGKALKDDSPAVTVSGLFEGRRAAAEIKEHSGILGIDIDQGDNEDLQSKRAALEKDPYCFACHHSIRGFGLVWYVKIDPTRHKDAFRSIEQYLANNYNVTVDPSGKDVSRLRFVSFDPELYFNKRSKKWDKYIPKKQQPKYTPTMAVFADEDMAHVMEQIKSGVNIADDYDAWIRIGFALAKQFGEAGRDYYHIVSSQSAKYDMKKVDKQFDISLRRSVDNDGVDIATFFWYCKQAGVSPKTRTTADIEGLAKQKIRAGHTKVEAFKAVRDYFSIMEGVDEKRVDEVLNGIKEIPEGLIRSEKADDKTTELELFIKSLNLQFNEITRKIEKDGEPLNDRDFNSIYLKAMHSINHNISKQKIFDLMDSELVPSYNPFKEFFKRYKDIKTEGLIKEVCDCIKYKKPDLDGDLQGRDYLETFLTKWLVSIIASMNGTYSLLVLVLTGGQRSGKTKFFRNLLPLDLKQYYAESKLDKDKDDGILMTQKLIIMDDEFSGKSKRAAAKFKEISSRDVFTVRKPYGRAFEDLKRYAVLCGTGNESEILNDPTGNRRLIPVNVLDIDHERFEAIDKTALFMELYRLWKKIGNDWMLTKEDVAFLNQATEENEAVDMDLQLILKLFRPADSSEPKSKFIQAADFIIALENVYGHKAYPNRIGMILQSAGFVKERKRVKGRRVYGYWVYEYPQNSYTSPENF